MKTHLFIWLTGMLLLTGCSIIRPGEVGIKTRLGVVKGDIIRQGPRFFNPFVARVIKFNTRTVEIDAKMELPTADGLNVVTDMALLYRLKPDSAKAVLFHYGKYYEQVIVLSTFRSVARDVSATFNAKDLVTAERDKIQDRIMEGLKRDLDPKGFFVEAVLLEEVDLPQRILASVEDKLKAEQAAQQMQYVLAKEKSEAERKRIEAEGIREYQRIVSQGLSEILIRWNAVQNLKDLSLSPNAKIIISNGTMPFMLNTEQQPKN